MEKKNLTQKQLAYQAGYRAAIAFSRQERNNRSYTFYNHTQEFARGYHAYKTLCQRTQNQATPLRYDHNSYEFRCEVCPERRRRHQARP